MKTKYRVTMLGIEKTFLTNFRNTIAVYNNYFKSGFNLANTFHLNIIKSVYIK